MDYKPELGALLKDLSLPSSPLIEYIRLGLEHRAIPLTSGQPHPDLYPITELADAAHEAICREGARFLPYGSSRGIGVLRQQLLLWQKENHILQPMVNDSNMMLTLGAQGGFDLLCQAFLRPGDLMACDAPSYPDSWITALRRGARLLPVPVDAEGIDTEALEESLTRGARPRLLYTIPTYQNPTGASLSPRRARHLTKLASRFGFLVALDDPYRYLHLDEPMRQGENYLPWLGWESDLVVLMGSLSKIIAPGLRVGWICAHASIVEKLAAMQEMAHISLPAVDALTVSAFIERHGLETQTEKMRAFLASQKKALLSALEKAGLGERGCFLRASAGGCFVCLDMPDDYPASPIARELTIKRKVATIPEIAFQPSRPDNNTAPDRFLRLSYSWATPDEFLRSAHAIREVLA